MQDAVKQRLAGAHIVEELNVESVNYMPMTSEHELLDYQVRPNYRALGPRFGRQVRQVAESLAALDAPAAVRELDELGSLHIEVDGMTETLESGDLDVRRTPREGFGVAEQDGVIVAIVTDVDDELAREGLARELVHATQSLRRNAGLEVSDRIRFWFDPFKQIEDVHRAALESALAPLEDSMRTAAASFLAPLEESTRAAAASFLAPLEESTRAAAASFLAPFEESTRAAAASFLARSRSPRGPQLPVSSPRSRSPCGPQLQCPRPARGVPCGRQLNWL